MVAITRFQQLTGPVSRVIGSDPSTGRFSMAKTAFVTGGTGFIGINLIELLIDEGWQVTALHRATSNLTYLKRFPVALAEGSITDPESLERAIPESTDVVFHVAGDTSLWAKKDAQQNEINIGGTRNMVEVARSKGSAPSFTPPATPLGAASRGSSPRTLPSKGQARGSTMSEASI